MANTLEWIMKLADQFSGPAGRIRKSAAGMSDDLKKVQKTSEGATKALRDSKGRFVSAPVQQPAILRDKNGRLRDPRGRFLGTGGSGLGGPANAKMGAFSAQVSSLRDELEPMLPVLGAVGAAVAGAVSGFAVGVVRAQVFKQDTMTALKTLLKTDVAAKSAFKTAAATADFIGVDRQEVLGQYVDLLAKGFSVSKVDEIVRAMADLSTVDPKANVDGLVRAIGQIRGKGRLMAEELSSQLAENGLELGDVYEQLSKIMGKSVADIPKLISAGKVDADTGIQAILAAINKQAGGGKAGAAAAAKASQNTSGLLKRLEAVPSNVFMALEVTPGMKALNSFLAGILGYFNLSTESGKRVVDVLGKVFNSFAKGLFGDKALSGDVTDGLDGIVNMLEKLEASGAFTALGTGLRLVANVVIGLVQFFEFLADTAADFGFVLGGIGDFFGSIGSAVAGMAGEMLSAGGSLIDGLVQGILGKAQGVYDAISQVAGGAVSMAKMILGIHSPSTVFAEIGGFVSQGFAAGAANDNSAQAAINAMVAPPAFAAAPGAQAARGGAAGGGVHVEVHELHIHAAGGSSDEIQAAVERALVRVARQAAAQAAA